MATDDYLPGAVGGHAIGYVLVINGVVGSPEPTACRPTAPGR
jgi:hypothetical protein